MELQNASLGTYGAKRQSWSGSSPRAVLHRLVNKNQKASPETIARLLLEEVRDDDTLLLPILVYWTNRNMRALQPRDEPATKSARAKVKRSSRAKVSKLVKRAKARINVMFLSMVMPNGKMLADCTGHDCSKFGGFYGKIAKKIGARDLVGDKLNEQDLMKLWKAK